MNGADILTAAQAVGTDNRPLVVAIKGTASSAIPTTGAASSTSSAVSRVATTTANATLKAANSSRLGLTIYNGSATANLYAKLGATASIGAGTESYTIRIQPNGYYEVPFRWTGIVDGIWDAADANGEAVITELT